MKHSRLLVRGIVAAVLGLAMIELVGCGGSARYPVEGTINLNGKPVDGGLISLVAVEESRTDPQTRVNANADIVGGKFTMDSSNGPNAGRYKVIIVWQKKTGKKITNDGPNQIDETEQVVPLEYNAGSQVIVEIKKEKNILNYELKGPPPNKDGGKKIGD